MIQRDSKVTDGRSRSWLRPFTAILLLSQSWIMGVSPNLAQTVAPTTADSETAPPSIENQAKVTYSYPIGVDQVLNVSSNTLAVEIKQPLVDPRGQILGCGGDILSDYTGFNVGLFYPLANDPTQSELGAIIDLTTTELPDIPNNSIPKGIFPNTENINPFPLSNEDAGRYSFLLDRSRGQLSVGSTYILVVDPPNTSRFSQRRVKIVVTQIEKVNSRELVSYRATSLDGVPIGVEGEMQLNQTVAFIADADRIGLELLAVQLNNTLCQVNQIQITKSADRANAAPGDFVIYRLNIKNISDGDLDEITVTDVLPVGFQILEQSVMGELEGQDIPVVMTRRGRNVTFRATTTLPMDESLRIIYATQITPDAVRGRGENRASVTAERVDNDLEVYDGPAIHRVRVGGGITSDCGTLIGRVFDDKNFDGEQQKGEPGIPNAVVFMDDGNRVTADEDGKFSVKCVLPGTRSGALDLLSVPGYQLAPNVKFIEANSPSRIVRLSPGGLARMNFPVTPIADSEGAQQ